MAATKTAVTDAVERLTAAISEAVEHDVGEALRFAAEASVVATERRAFLNGLLALPDEELAVLQQARLPGFIYKPTPRVDQIIAMFGADRRPAFKVDARSLVVD